jgi:Tfp pilus assembly protein PilN
MNSKSSKNSEDLSRREKFLVAALFAAALIACFFNLDGLATFREIQNLHLEQSRIRTEIGQLDAMLANEQQIKANYLETAPDRQRYQKLIPSIEQQPAAIGDLEKLIQGGPGKMLTARVNEIHSYDEYSVQTITFTIGELPFFPEDLLLQLENYPQLLIIEQLNWQTGETDAGTINLTLRLYYLN